MANLCAKFEVSSLNRSRDMEGFPKFTEWLTNSLTHSLTDRHTNWLSAQCVSSIGQIIKSVCVSFWPNFALFRLDPPVANLHAKFEVSSFNRSGDMEESQNLKSRSRGLFTTPVDLILHFSCRSPRGQPAWQIWSFYLQPFPRYGSQMEVRRLATSATKQKNAKLGQKGSWRGHVTYF